MAAVTIDIPSEFLPPEILILNGSGCIAAAFMSVPEAAMDEYHCSVFREHKIGGAWQLPHMKSIAKPSGKKKGAKHPFWPSVLSANARHHSAALRSGRDAHGGENIPFGYLQKQRPQASAKKSERMMAVHWAVCGSLPCV
jgi:hypothetical protein